MSIEAITYVKLLDLGEAESAALRLFLYVLAENTFNDSGLSRVGRKELAWQTGRCSQRSISRYLDKLEDEASFPVGRVIARHPQYEADTGARLEDAVELVGFLAWLTEQRTSTRGLADRLSRGEGAANLAGRGGLPDKLSGGGQGQLLSVPPGQQVSPTEKDNRTSNRTSEDSPPTPSPRGVRESEELQLLEELKRDDRDLHVVEALIEPVLRQRTLLDTPDPLFALRWVRTEAAPVAREHLEAATRLLLEKRKLKVKISDFEDAIAEAKTAAKRGVCISFASHPEAAAAWLLHAKVTGNRFMQRQLETGAYVVPTLMPPDLKRTDHLADERDAS